MKAESASRQFLILSGSLLFLLAGCSGVNQPAGDESVQKPKQAESKRIASENVVKVTAQQVEIAAGSSGEVILRLTIDPGYHVNANPPTYPYLKATELEIAAAEGISVNRVAYPPPISRKFPFAEEALAVYEGDTEIKAKLAAARSAGKGERSLSAVLRIQACDEQVCYAPGKIDLQIPVTIK